MYSPFLPCATILVTGIGIYMSFFDGDSEFMCVFEWGELMHRWGGNISLEGVLNGFIPTYLHSPHVQYRVMDKLDQQLFDKLWRTGVISHSVSRYVLAWL